MVRLHAAEDAPLIEQPASSAQDAAAQAARGLDLLKQDRVAEALAALRMAVSLGDGKPRTLLNLALAEDRAGDPVRARALMAALEYDVPGWAEPSLRLALSLRATDPVAAQAAYRRALDCDPGRREALVGLAGLLVTANRGAEAQSLLIRACGRDPDDGEAWHLLGVALGQTGDCAAAESALTKAQRLMPDSLDVALHRAEAAIAAGNTEGALALLTEESEADPISMPIQAARAALLEALGRRDEAIDALDAACALAPDHPGPAHRMGSMLARAQRSAEAAAALRRAVELDPANGAAISELACALMRLHRHHEAQVLLEDWLDRQPDDAGAMCNLATALVSGGDQAGAARMARRAVARSPGAGGAWRTLANVLAYGDGVPAQLESLAGCARLLRRDWPKAAEGGEPPFLGTREPGRRLRVGLLSGSLRTHPVGWLTLAGWEALDPAGFEIVALGPRNDTVMARRFAAIAAAWHDASTMTDDVLARHCREIGLDIVVDMGGYGDAGRMPACARRLAPVQIKWVGMQCHSTGLPEMDWFLTDRWETPAGFEPLYTERLLRLPDGYVCYTPPPHAPDVVALPALARGHVTFGCFNNLAKVTPEVIATWSAILHRVPGSCLVLKTQQFGEPALADRVHAAFAAHGIAPDRLDLRGASPHRQFLAEYGDLDIVLDPFPYSGGLTTCEALWMGVPSVTLPGESFASRHTLSHQSNAGLTGWNAGSPAEYVDLAVRRAADLPALAELRAGLRAQVKASPLCDASRFGRSLGGALRHAWQVHCGAVS